MKAVDAGTFRSSLASLIRIEGECVALDVTGSGDFAAFIRSLEELGFQVEATAPAVKLVEGLLLISQIPAVEALPQTIGLAPVYRPLLNRPTRAGD